ncbi:MAG: hypothetical protein ACK5Z2_18000 [Bacteroidota bacterium]|jgi:hypothetical protein
MKKILAFALPALFVLSFTACGPSEAEEKKEKDSISNEMSNEGDSIIAAMNIADSITKAVAKADSVKKADSAASANKK